MTLWIDGFLNELDRLTPSSLAEEWDNTGLQLGSRQDSVESVLVALNVTGEVIEEAAASGCGLILSHHPLIFQPLASASDDSATGRLLRQSSKAGIAVVTAHTNLDSAPGGLADILAGLIGLKETQPLSAAPAGVSKLVVFVPESDLEAVRGALFDAGAGHIGDYQHCSYISSGTGTFLPMEGAEPTIGKVGRDEQVAEARLEVVFPEERQQAVVDALLKAHSYEEPAYDIYPLNNTLRDAGAGRIGSLDVREPLTAFASRLAALFGMESVRFSGEPDKAIGRVAVVPGSGADYIGLCAAASADALVTGDIKYHQALEAAGLGLALVDIPHEISENAALGEWSRVLATALERHKVSVMMSAVPVSGLWRVQGMGAGEAALPQKAGKPGKQLRAEKKEHKEPESQEKLFPENEQGLHQLHVDGGSRGNPGPAAIGAVITAPDGEAIETLSRYIGVETNNVAEYQAMIAGLQLALDRGITGLAVFSDSELIVRQLLGAYRVRNEGLRPYYEQAKSLLSLLEEFEITSVPREHNAHADELVNAALDAAAKP